MDERRDEPGKIDGARVSWQVALQFSPSEPFAQRNLHRSAARNQFVPNRVDILCARQRTLHQKTSVGVMPSRQHGGRSVQEPFYRLARGWLLQRVAQGGSGPLGVAIECFAEQGFLIPKSGVETGAVNAHSLGQIVQRRALVTL